MSYLIVAFTISGHSVAMNADGFLKREGNVRIQRQKIFEYHF